MDKDQFVIEVDDLPYDRGALEGVFQQAKPYARIKGLGWQDNSHLQTWTVDTAPAVVIYSGSYMNIDTNRKDLNYNFLRHGSIKKMIDRLNFSHPITEGNVDMIWYRPGFKFEPHIDHYAKSTMMWPIIPNDAGAPIDFYYKSDIDLAPLIQSGKPAGFKDQVTDEDICCTHYYSTAVPTIFNSLWIHGVRPVAQERVYLRLRVNEPFESIVSKHRSGTLVR